MRIGYGRVSTLDQHPEAQHHALTAAGCEQIFIDKASGKLASRPELSKALLVAKRPKDQLITKLDRLGRSLGHLIELSKTLQDRGVDLVVLDQGIDTSTAVGRMFFQILGAIAEFEHTLMSERTRGRIRRHPPHHPPTPQQDDSVASTVRLPAATPYPLRRLLLGPLSLGCSPRVHHRHRGLWGATFDALSHPETRTQLAEQTDESRSGLARLFGDTGRTVGALYQALLVGIAAQALMDPGTAPTGAELAEGLRRIAGLPATSGA
ncbi:recombinase family protein [Nocardia sp. NPDC046763]|uniref:recombinase family protein n=1 Tax=Nocardia sp. NPDC046763 TaxID=3155256 RepID=UPI0033D92C45